MRSRQRSFGLSPSSSGFRASFAASVAHDATPGVVGTVSFSGNRGAVSIVGGATTDEPGDNGGLFSVATNLQVTFDVNSEFDALDPGTSLTTTDTITLTDGTTSIPVNLSVTVSKVVSLDEDWYWHVLSLTHNGNLPEDAGRYVGLAANETAAVTLDSGGDVLANITTLPNLANPLGNNFVHTSAPAGSEVDKVFVDVPNFYGQPTVGTDFDTAVNILVATWQHFNTEWTTDPEILLMSSIAEPGVGNAFSWTGSDPSTCTREDFDAWASFNKSSTRRDWFTSTLITEAASDEPSGTFAAIDPMAYIWDAIRGTDLNDFDCADWYSDAAPHGNPDWYAALGMTIWSIMMDRESVTPVTYPTGDITWPTGVTTAFQNAASAFATRVSNLVQGTAVAPNAPQTDEIDIATGSGSNEIDVTVNSVPETLTNIEYSVNGGSSWSNLGRTTAGSQTLTMASGSTSYAFLWRYTNATGTGQVSVSDSGGHWTATSAAGGDVTAPTLSSATDAANGSTASTGSVSTNEGNGTLYWVVTTSATAPSVAQIQAGQDNSGSAAADSGSQSVSGTGVQTISPAPSGLSAETSYTTHFQHADAAGNDSTVVSASGFTTDAESDVTAPTLSSATDAADGSTASTGSVSTNEGNGTLYWVVTTSATAPSVAQIQAGQDNSGVAAAASGNQSVSGTGVQTISPAPSGLSASTAYTTHFQHQDAATNDSTVASASGFTTDAGSISDSGWFTAGTVSVGSDGDEGFDDAPSVSSLGADDGSEATLLFDAAGNESHTVTLTNFGIGTGDIPSSSTIVGVSLRFTDAREGIGGDRPWTFSRVQMHVGGSPVGTAKTDVPATDISQGAGGTSPQTFTLGGNSDDWDASITDTQARASTTGVEFQMQAVSPGVDGNPLAALDMFEIQYHYT